MPRNYGDGSNSSVGAQLRTELYQKKAMTEARKKQFFGQLADTFQMPKHMGKNIKRYVYLPLLDDANNNSEGIDAAGNSDILTRTIEVTAPEAHAEGTSGWRGLSKYFTVEGTDNGTTTAQLLVLLQAQIVAWAILAKNLGGAGLNTANLIGSALDNYTEVTTTGDESAFDLGFRFVVHDAVARHGNLYGSSKDVGTIAAKMPTLTETGGRVNRVGFKRIEVEGTLHKFGFFDEYTQESIDFDTDSQLMQHVNREMLNGAYEITEDALQIDLLNGAGIVRLGGEATSVATMTGANGATPSVISFNDLSQLDIALTDNRTSRDTKIITGTGLTDTKTIAGARYMYIGSELIPMFENMVDNFSNAAFVPVEKYAGGTTLALGEIGSCGKFRLILVPEMMHWSGAGAAEGTNDGYRATGGNYDVFPMLVVGNESFTTVGFQSSGKNNKFTIYHKKPGLETADKTDPYGEQGFMSIKWYYGFMWLRPERVAVCKTVARW